MPRTAVITIWLLLFFVPLPHARGGPGGSVLVALHELQNPDNTNYQFEIWVTCDGKTSDTGCLYGKAETGLFSNVSHGIVFSDDLGNGLHNPLKYSFTSFQGNLGITIFARDATGSEIHKYRYHNSVYPDIYDAKTWTNITLSSYGRPSSRMRLGYQVHCKEHYYSPSCSIGCIPGANYVCDKSSGRKLCNANWLGPDCTCKPHGHQYTCDPGTGKRICFQPWYGEDCDIKCQAKHDLSAGYTCDSTTGAKVCLSGWYGKECNETTPVIPRALISSSLVPAKKSSFMMSSAMASSLLTSTSLMPSTLQVTPSPKMSPSSLPTSSSLISFHMTSSLIITSSLTMMASPIMMSSLTMTSSQEMTSSLEAAMMTSPGLSQYEGMQVIRNHTLQFENSYPHMTFVDTSYLRNLESQITTTLVTSEASNSQTELSRDGIRLHETVSHFIEPTLSTKLASPDKTHNPEHYTEKMVPSTESGVTEEALDEPTLGITTLEHDMKQSGVPKEPKDKPTASDTTFRSGSTDTRKKEDRWWLISLPLVSTILLTAIAIAALRKKMRKRRKVSPHYQTSMQTFHITPNSDNKNGNVTEHGEQNLETSADIQNKEQIGGEDFEAIWKVIATSHA